VFGGLFSLLALVQRQRLGDLLWIFGRPVRAPSLQIPFGVSVAIATFLVVPTLTSLSGSPFG
jgi:hypothetical protein